MSLIPFFHSFYLVYVIIAVFCLASAMSLYNCLAALIGEIPFGQCRYRTPFNCYKYKVSFGYFLVATQASVRIREEFSVGDFYKGKLQAPSTDKKGTCSIIKS